MAVRLFVLGATGRTGRALLAQATERGHDITAFVRSPDKLAELDGLIAVRRGDPLDVEELLAALRGHDVVISALGLPGLGESTVLSDAARAVVRAMEAARVRRLLVVSAGMLFEGSGAIGSILRRTFLRHVATDSARMEQILQSSGLDWTIVRPPRLTDGPPAGGYVAADYRMPPDSRLSMRREDLASFLLDEVERPAHVRCVVGLSAPAGRGRTTAYWLATLVLATECVVGGLMGSLRMQPFLGIIGHLGYPPDFMSILGAWYVLAGLALLAPHLPRLKEWAYAGLIFNYTGAAASHLVMGDGARALVGPIFFAALTSISWALRPSARRDLSPPSAAGTATAVDRGGHHRIRTIAYWTFTLMIAAEMVAGSMWDLLEIEYVRAVMTHLGYPLYLLLVLGAWKLPCAVALLVPRFPRLKEWAYAGAFFNYSGAVLSHLSVGDGADRWAAPLVFAGVTLASWALRPPERRLALERPPGSARPAGWIVPLGLVVVFIVLSLLTLPRGSPPP
jgi:putative NADH-flavin reductase